MNRTLASILLFFLIGNQLVAVFGKATCNQMSCGTASCCDDNKIGAVCYNPNQYDCAVDNSNHKVLCGKGSGACNGICFDSKNYHCSDKGIAQGAAPKSSAEVPKTSATQAPTAAPTSKQAATSSSAPKTSTSVPKTSTSAATPATSANNGDCKPGTCGAGLSCCGKNQCYSSVTHGCATDKFTGAQMVCPAGFSTCKGGCYDRNVYSCTASGLSFGREADNGNNNPQTLPTPTPTSTSKSPVVTSSETPKTSVIVNPIPVPVPSRPTNNLPTQTADLRIINNCKYTLWIEGRYGGKGVPIPGQSTTSTKATPGAYVDYTIPATGLSGTRFWAKYGCDANGKNCKIGDQMQYYPEGGCPANGCTAPIDSLFEATFGCKPGSSCYNANPTTWFDTSQVDGYTIPYKVTMNGEKNKCDCSSKGCGLDVIDASRLDLSRCPSGENLSGTGGFLTTKVGGLTKSLTSVDLRLIDKETNSILGCYSPCKKLSHDWGLNEGTLPTLYYCCPTPNPANCQIGNGCISPQACSSGPVIKTEFVNSIHQMAPGIYTYAYDDGVGLHACPAGTVTYTMEFCPAGSSAFPHPL